MRAPVTLATLSRVAGIRWSIEECFQAAKGAVGLDQHQVRRWRSWYRYTSLVMLAHAVLAVIAAHEREQRPAAQKALIPLSVNEIRHLFAKLITNTLRTISYWLHWSQWRRQHQTRARTSHYAPTKPKQRSSSVYVTIPGWSTSGASPQPNEACSCLRCSVADSGRGSNDGDRCRSPLIEPREAMVTLAGRACDRSLR